MDVLSTLNVTSHVADTVYNFATYKWNKKTVIQLIIVGGVFIVTACAIKYIDSKTKEGKRDE